jgi:hypothetical protein
MSSVENDRYVLKPLFRYDEEKDRLEATGEADVGEPLISKT